jgi:hypothetical protein
LFVSELAVLDKWIWELWVLESFARYFAIVRDSPSIKRISRQKSAGIYSREKITNVKFSAFQQRLDTRKSLW